MEGVEDRGDRLVASVEMGEALSANTEVDGVRRSRFFVEHGESPEVGGARLGVLATQLEIGPDAVIVEPIAAEEVELEGARLYLAIGRA